MSQCRDEGMSVSGAEVKGPPLKRHRIRLELNQGWQISRTIFTADKTAPVIIFKSLSFNFKWLLLICSSEFRRCHCKKQKAHAGKNVSPQPFQTLHTLLFLLSSYTWPKGTPPHCIQVDPDKTSETIRKSHPERFMCHSALCMTPSWNKRNGNYHSGGRMQFLYCSSWC